MPTSSDQIREEMPRFDLLPVGTRVNPNAGMRGQGYKGYVKVRGGWEMEDAEDYGPPMNSWGAAYFHMAYGWEIVEPGSLIKRLDAHEDLLEVRSTV